LIVLGDALGGIALLTLGWFAHLAMRVRRRRDRLARLIEGLTVGDAMETVPFVVVPQATLDTFAAALEEGDEATVARVMRGEELLGLVGPREIGRVPRGRWGAVHGRGHVNATGCRSWIPARRSGGGPRRLHRAGPAGCQRRTARRLTRLAVVARCTSASWRRRDAGS
jgi:hypothetical protein